MTQEPQQPEQDPNTPPWTQATPPPAEQATELPADQASDQAAVPPVGPPAQPPAPGPWGEAPQPPAWDQRPQPRWGQYAPTPPQGQGQPGAQYPPNQYPPNQYPAGQYPGAQQYPGAYPGGPPAYGQQNYGQPYGGYTPPPKPGVIPLRPLGLGEVLDGAFQAARRNGKAMFGSALIVQAVSAILTLVIGVFVIRTSTIDQIVNGTMSESELGGLAVSVGATLLVAILFQTLAQMVLQGALVIPVLRAVLNRKTSFGAMWRLARPRVGTLLLLALLYLGVEVLAFAIYAGILFVLTVTLHGVGIGLGIVIGLALGAATIWASLKVVLAPAAVMVENLGVFGAIKSSWHLTTRHWWRTFGITLLAALIASVIAGIVSTPISFILGLVTTMINPNPTPDQLTGQLILTQVISAVISALVGAVTLAFQSGVMALLYVDLRMRRNGFDVVLLRESESGTDDGGIPGRSSGPVAAGGPGAPNGALP